MSPTPPRTHYLDDIIKIIANADRMRAQNFEQGIKFQEEQKVNQANIDAQKALEKHRQDVEKRLEKEHGDLLKQQDIINAATKNIAEAQHFATKVDLAKRINAGETVPGAEYSKVYTMPGSEQFPQMNLPSMSDARQVTVPMGGDKTYQAVHPSVESHAREQANLARIQGAPDLEAKKELENVKGMVVAFGEGDKQRNRMELARLNQGEANKRAQLAADSRIEAAKFRVSAGGEFDETDRSALHEMLKTGQKTDKQLLAGAGSPRMRDKMGKEIQDYRAAGGVDMNEEQQKSLLGFSQAANLLRTQDDYLNKADDIQSGGPLTKQQLWLRKQIHSQKEDDVWRIHNQIESTGSQLARDLGVIGTQSNKDTLLAILGNAPGLNDPLDQAIAKRNTNVQRLLNRFYKTYHNYKGEALENLKKQAGIDQLEDEYNLSRRGSKNTQTPAPQAQGVAIPAPSQSKRKSLREIYDSRIGPGPEPQVKPSPMR